ncbi:hypothetical protein EHQ68_16660 [Leptospira congkakensis]|uniref:Protein CR006 P-loop domain-containing protein n=1 Tax=Leptospira congkakensis TaxID=2484932 RepID=A0A8B5NG87_9LEPT|nr:AAA family ATPase [Leptospira congkakensis]TGL85790.1 hypothetical protein EHQ68_16660 [Leptospira congkakensis]TGL87013.1 hypothetical protein EHQ69_17830 [Leptospira congkakensis]
MNQLEIKLNSYPDRFSENSLNLTITNKINYLYGKNGTGKSTIAKTICDQHYDKYNILLFTGFERVVGENERLDAIALGTENTEIQKEIEIVSKEINEIYSEIDPPETGKQNLFSKLNVAIKNLQKHEKLLNEFYTNAARDIKNKKYDNVNIAPPSYNKENFINELLNASILTPEEIKTNSETLSSIEKYATKTFTVTNTKLDSLLNNINEILNSKVSQRILLKELEENIRKQNFAKEGFEIHEHKVDEICSFCGNQITDERWNQLANYFNDEVKKFELNIDQNINLCISNIEILKKTELIEKDNFLKQYAANIDKLNLKIKYSLSQYELFYSKLVESLKNKKRNLFEKSPKLEIEIQEDFSSIISEYETIIQENNEFSKNLNKEQEIAKNKLRYNEIQNSLNGINYTNTLNEIEKLKFIKNGLQDSFDQKKTQLNSKITIKNELILKTKDEKKIANQINKLLRQMGVGSFALELIENDIEGQKGQYKIKGHNNEIRPITNLSQGEKNIIAFLYFLLSIENPENNQKPKIIILDDPMTSNDDTMQYLMIGEIQKFSRKLNDSDFLLIFTHNVHFYLNVRPNTAIKYKINGEDKSHYIKFGNYHLFSNGTHTTIKKIENGKHDFITNYEMLWKELIFLFESDEPNLMLNVCRKISETFMHFTKKGVEAFYGDNLSAKKLFDVNQHSLDDFDAEQNGKTKFEIIDILKSLFKENNATDHFENYFKVK